MIERLVPNSVATAATRSDVVGVELFPEEARLVAGAVQRRRREFVTGRACARDALAKLGITSVAIPSGERGEPLWPLGVVGSITHCSGYRACAVARTSRVTSIGIDAEENAPLPDRILERIAFGSEREFPAYDGPASLDRLLFCAKEAVYKAWFPIARRWLGFEDVEVSIDVEQQAFTSRLLVPAPALGGIALRELRGRWCAEDGILCAAVII